MGMRARAHVRRSALVILGGFEFDESHYFLLYVVGVWTGVRDTSDGLIRDERDTAR